VSEGNAPELGEFRAAGRALFSLGLVPGGEGNLSSFDGERFVITRSGSTLADLEGGDLVAGRLTDALPGASSDADIHRALHRERGPGAVVHAHPPGTVPEGDVVSGAHGVYVAADSLEAAVGEVVRQVRGGAAPAQQADEVPL
jgi:hypothetical protein